MEREDMEFSRKISENMSAAFDADKLVVSEELIQKTLQRIQTESEQSKKTKNKKIYKYIGTFAGLAAACLVLFVGFKVISGSNMAKSESASDRVESSNLNMTSMKAMDSGALTAKADTEYAEEAGIVAEEPEACESSMSEEAAAEADFYAEEPTSETTSALSGSGQEASDSADMKLKEEMAGEYTVYELDEAKDADKILEFKSLIDSWPMEKIDVLPNDMLNDEREMNWTGEIWLTEGDTVILYSYNNSDLMYKIIYAQEDIETYYKVSDLSTLTEKIAEILE